MALPSGRFPLPGHQGVGAHYEAVGSSIFISGKSVRVLYRRASGTEEVIDGEVRMIARSAYHPEYYLCVEEVERGRPRNFRLEGIDAIVDLGTSETFMDVSAFLDRHSVDLAL